MSFGIEVGIVLTEALTVFLQELIEAKISRDLGICHFPKHEGIDGVAAHDRIK